MRHIIRAAIVVAVGIVLLNLPVDAQPPREAVPAPLLKPVSAPSGQARVRVPLYEGEQSAIRLHARLMRKRSEPINCTAALDTTNRSVVSAKMLQKWGIPRPKGNLLVLPELWVAGNLLSSRSGKGSDVFIRVPNLRVEVIETAPDESGQFFGADLMLNFQDLLRTAGRSHEARFHFPERFLDVTEPAIAIKRPGNGEEYMPEPRPESNPSFVHVACPVTIHPGNMAHSGMTFGSAAINGQDTFVNTNGQPQALIPNLASTTHGSHGIIMNVGMAHALKLDVDLNKQTVKGKSTEKNLNLVEYTVKELRLGAMAGPGLKTPKDLVFKNVPIWIEVNESEPGMWIGYPFLAKHFHDGVLALTPDGKAAMHGRVPPEMVQERIAKKR